MFQETKGVLGGFLNKMKILQLYSRSTINVVCGKEGLVNYPGKNLSNSRCNYTERTTQRVLASFSSESF